jgi:uncharacterized protein YybS (DUF2232 family)
MAGHVHALAILQIVYSSLGLLVGIGVFLLFGGIATMVGLNSSIDESLVAIPVLTFIGSFAASVIILLSLPRLIAGIGLLKQRNWARVLTLVVSAIGLVDIPVGTGLGIYAFWVLTRSETATLFAHAAEPAVGR